MVKTLPWVFWDIIDYSSKNLPDYVAHFGEACCEPLQMITPGGEQTQIQKGTSVRERQAERQRDGRSRGTERDSLRKRKQRENRFQEKLREDTQRKQTQRGDIKIERPHTESWWDKQNLENTYIYHFQGPKKAVRGPGKEKERKEDNTGQHSI